MVEMMIKSLKDQTLKTVMGRYWLVEGEVKLVQFKNMQEFEAHVEMQTIMPAPQGAQEHKDIPVVIPVPMEGGLPTALYDGEQLLELSHDPEEEEIPNEVTVAAMEELVEDMEPATDVEELLDRLEEDEDEEEGSWTNEIDRV